MADWQLGEIEVTSILEQVAEFMTLEEFFDGFTPEMFEANKDWLLPNVGHPQAVRLSCLSNPIWCAHATIRS